MKLSLSFLLSLLLALLSAATAQEPQAYVPSTDYYGEEGGGQTDPNQAQGGPSTAGGQADVPTADGPVDATEPAHVHPHKNSTHEVVDYTQPDPNPFNNEYPCQGPWYECVGMDKLEAFVYIKERMKYCADTDSRVMMYSKAEGKVNRVFAHVNSDGTVTKVAAA
mmetsp:Transcript_20045/g.28522  ORF Transcript_20045/g.28522 Transcript_20045/m.28522 type:complete len:165 (+) Transcript_20045:34-528(+)|eukprot:CAMPEP_0172423250 /NCGR_PEP_ID=MMETSP1064-20121228/14528_1 /TAXON_ID=202472 /ORGANISM="Aulacoseira subarctica , Strain CCAP 1002/5" /LENGTH=164 /DNA_ID=CAMNT_0013164509 /DNA_START=34 /DNA_END=528 /DNA_ORIENTATION=+